MVKILDTTLRDGSYVVDFQLTAHDTALIAAALDACNVPFIEVGHGVGMNASANPRMRAASTDEEYLRATAGAVKNARWGMFFIPGIARMEDLELAASYGMSLVRIGTSVTEVAQSEKFIARARKLGMYVSANFMKTYAATPDDVGRFAKQSAEYGTDIVCVVDSAGGMFPEDVRAYFDGIRAHTDVPLGFHGHNNMGLAIANSLSAVELGAEVVDTSIRGMGRSAGNASTEILLLALRRRGIDVGIDPLQIMTIAEQRIDPMLRNYPQVDSIGIISGYAQFHSSFLGTIVDYAQRYSVDPRQLILHVTQEDKVNAPAALVERLAQNLAEQSSVPRRVSVTRERAKASSEKGQLGPGARDAITDAHVLARKYGKTAVFNLVQSYREPLKSGVSSTVADGVQYVVASAEVGSAKDARTVVEAIDGIAELILLDCDVKSPDSRSIIDQVLESAKKSKVLRYSDLGAWSRSVVAMVSQRIGQTKSNPAVEVVGENVLADMCRRHLALMGLGSGGAAVQAIVACEALPGDEMIERLAPDGFVVDALIGAVTPEVATACRDRGIAIYRPDMRAVIHSEVAAATGIATLVSRVQGIGSVNGVSVAAGGMLAPRGTIIVDSVQAPTRVFGVADGGGLLLSGDQLTEELQRRLAEVEETVASIVG